MTTRLQATFHRAKRAWPFLSALVSCALLSLLFPQTVRILLTVASATVALAALRILPLDAAALRRVDTALLFAAVTGFLVFTAATSVPPGEHFPSKAPRHYYNALVSNMLRGRLCLDIQPDSSFLSLKNPYDFHERMRTVGWAYSDLSYFNGKFYLYFGLTPIVVLYLPFRLLTGRYLPDYAAATILALAAIVFAVLLLRLLVRNKWLTSTSCWVQPRGAVVVLGLCSLVPFILRRPVMYEVAGLGGACFSTGGLLLAAQSTLVEEHFPKPVPGMCRLVAGTGNRVTAVSSGILGRDSVLSGG
jgi:hypothetical protein